MIAADVAEELLDSMPERVRGAIVSARHADIADALAQAAERARWAEADPAHRAAELSRARLLGDRRDTAELDGFGPPAFAVGRPH